jgi:extracellular elastinolytic metalloproteinase
MHIRTSFAVAAFLMLILLFLPARSGAFVRPPEGKTVPDYDIRLLERRVAPAAIPPSLATDLTRRGFLWSLNPSTGALKSVMAGRQSLTPAQAGDPVDIARAFIASHEDWFGLPFAGTQELAIEASFTTTHNGMHHVWFVQRHEGVEVFNGRIGVHLDKGGRIFAVSADEIASFFEPRVPGEIDAATALSIAATSIGEPLQGETPVPVSPAATRIVRFEKGNFGTPPEAELVYFNDGGQARAAWKVKVDPRSRSAAYLVIVDAANAEVILRQNRMLYAQGLVFPEDPDSTPNRIKVDFGVKPESPLGWVDTSAAITTGNNVHAYHDPGLYLFILCLDGTPEEIEAPPAFQDFSYPIDLAQDPSTYKGAAIANLFYLNNFMHDYLYRLGFDEASGNYQVDNFGLGGAEGDLVEAQAQDGWPDCEYTLLPNTNNANFTPGPDGATGKMQMYIWTMTDPPRDGDLDSDIVMHEYCHGLSSRLVGGPAAGGAGLGNAQGGAMGEGWSDFFAASSITTTSWGNTRTGLPAASAPTRTANPPIPSAIWVTSTPAAARYTLTGRSGRRPSGSSGETTWSSTAPTDETCWSRTWSTP